MLEQKNESNAFSTRRAAIDDVHLIAASNEGDSNETAQSQCLVMRAYEPRTAIARLCFQIGCPLTDGTVV